MTAIYSSPSTRSCPFSTLSTLCLAQLLIALNGSFFYTTLSDFFLPGVSHSADISPLYAIVFVALLLAGGSLSDYFGAQRVFTFSMVLVVLSSLGGVLTAEGHVALCATSGLAIATALAQPSLLAISRLTASRRQFHLSLAAIMSISLLAVLSIKFANTHYQLLTWHSMQTVNLALGIVTLALIFSHTHTHQHMRPRGKISLGILPATIAVAALMWALLAYIIQDEANFIANRTAALAMLITFIYEKYAPNPLFTQTRGIKAEYAVAVLCAACYAASSGGQLYLIDRLLSDAVPNLTPSLPLIFAAIAFMMLLGGWMYSRFSATYSNAKLLCTGFTVATIGLSVVAASLEHGFQGLSVAGVLLVSLAQGLLLPAILALGLNQRLDMPVGHITATILTGQLVAGAITVAILSSQLDRVSSQTEWSLTFQIFAVISGIGLLIAFCHEETED